MVKINNWIVITIAILILVNLLPLIVHAQSSSSPIGGIDPGGDPDAPIDGGVGLLIAAGVVYGIRKGKAKNKK